MFRNVEEHEQSDVNFLVQTNITQAAANHLRHLVRQIEARDLLFQNQCQILKINACSLSYVQKRWKTWKKWRQSWTFHLSFRIAQPTLKIRPEKQNDRHNLLEFSFFHFETIGWVMPLKIEEKRLNMKKVTSKSDLPPHFSHNPANPKNQIWKTKWPS